MSELREQVWQANRDLVGAGLVTLSFGNASGSDRDAGVVVIKPSGVPYTSLRPDDMVVVSLAEGTVVDGDLRPSSDTPTHLELYRRFTSIGGVVHTHSSFASAWAQAIQPIPPLGTTHADHFAGAIPVTRRLTDEEIDGDYERETGVVIGETIAALGFDPLHMPAALVASHGPFTWGSDAADAVTTAIALEAVAAMAHRTLALDPRTEPIGNSLLGRHFRRKHGPDAYYGQGKA
ncbi:MAG: L-ribulose-5-phosphate 4-epimerase AraD [Chloroflexi bacterium]|nr:L-ribulose-5-phosphate 4-epimerase AraD [Chloroflexota bacterium]